MTRTPHFGPESQVMTLAEMKGLGQAFDLAREFGRLLAGKSPEVQGVVLAELLSKWLAGHIDLDSKESTRRTREDLLRVHVDTVRKLVPESAKEIGLPW